jgi:hypothetical protein
MSGVAGAGVTGIGAAIKRHRDLKTMENAKLRKALRKVQDDVLELQILNRKRG